MKDGETSKKTPYEHLWSFLAKDDGKYLFAVNRWLYKGKKLPFSKQSIAKEALKYLTFHEVPERDVTAVRYAIYKLNEDCVAAKNMEDLSGAGNEENEAFADASKKKCPVWEEAKEYYLSKNAGENLNSLSTIDSLSVSSGGSEEENDAEENDAEENDDKENVVEDKERFMLTAQSGPVAERVIDDFLEGESTDQENRKKVFDNVVEFNNEMQRKKIRSEIYVQFLEALMKEKESGLSIEEKMALANQYADDQMNKD
ncbi:unnamed protein product [Mucor hiemalis]